MIQNVILWLLVLVIAFFAGRLVSKIKLPGIRSRIMGKRWLLQR